MNNSKLCSHEPIRKKLLISIGCWIAVCCMCVSSWSAEPDGGPTPELYSKPPELSVAVPALDRGMVWQRRARLNVAAVRKAGIAAGKAGSRVAFATGSGEHRLLRLESFRPTDGGWLAKGIVEEVPGSRAILLTKNGQLAATLNVPGDGVYVIQGTEDGECVVRKIDPLTAPRCGVTDMGFQEAALKRLKDMKAAKVSDAKSSDVASLPDEKPEGIQKPAADDNHVLAGEPATIDIMVVYTADARVGGGGTAAMEALIELAVEEANDCYLNSQINVRLNLVHSEEVPYVETGDIGGDLYNLFLKSDGLSGVQNLQQVQYKADLVCLLTEREDTGYIAGIAYLLQDYPTGSRDLGFSVVLRAYAVGIYAFAHEVGHNLGCAHDRLNAGGQGTFPYSYGHRFAAQGITYATVMTYPPGVRIPYFSNPQISYNGSPTGLVDGDPNSADNAATINLTGPDTVSTYYTALRRYSYSQPTFTVSEGVGQATITVHLAETIGTTSSRTVKFATKDGTALAGQDYVAKSGTLTFASGQTDASFTVGIMDDAAPESQESFLVSLSDPLPLSTSGLGLDYQATVVITDNENSFYFGAPNLVVSESQGGAAATVFRQGSTAGSASVTVRPVAGTALPTSDYDPADRVATFGVGETQKTITIPLVNDFAGEVDKTLSLSLVMPSAGFAVASPATVNVSLLDDDRPGAVDVTLNDLTGPNDNVFALATRPDGSVLVGGGFARINDGLPAGIAQFKGDGAFDASFNPGIGVSGTVFALGLQSDGKVVLGGVFTAVTGVTRNNLARLNVDGSLDTQFDPGIGPDETVRTLAVMEDGRIVIGGFFSNYQGQYRPFIARVLANGSLDSSFNPGTGPSAPIRTLVVQPDGSVVIGGDFTQVGGVDHPFIARLNSSGALDAGFTAGVSQTVRALALMQDGDVITGGEFTSVNGVGYSYVARLNSNGTTDTAFNLATRPNGFVRAIAVQSDQQILIAGDFTSIGGQSLGRIGRLNPNGTVDSAFAPGSGANDIIYGLAIDPGKYVIAGGSFDQFAGVPRSRVARVRITQNVESFDPVMVPLVRSDVTGGPITVHFEGRAGNRYSLDGSEDLSNWSGIVTNMAPADVTELTDPAPPATRRFYRIRQVP